MDLGEFYEKYKQYYYWKLSRNISGMGLIFPAEDIIHDVVVTMIADEKHRTKFERLPETEAKAYFMSCLKHRLVDIIRREKRRREYLETLERYEKKLETENSNTEMIVVEELDSGNNIAGTLKLLRPEERELLHLAFIQKMPYREIAGRSQLRESDEASEKAPENMPGTRNFVWKNKIWVLPTGKTCAIMMSIFRKIFLNRNHKRQ